jgi:hypothetical protein
MSLTTKLVALLMACGFVLIADARPCTTHTVIGPDGRIIICTVCCDANGNCTTQCIG